MRHAKHVSPAADDDATVKVFHAARHIETDQPGVSEHDDGCGGGGGVMPFLFDGALLR